jgi:hypothetical protein
MRPWATWQRFLHRTHRAAVEAHHAGPTRVTGGPGNLRAHRRMGRTG